MAIQYFEETVNAQLKQRRSLNTFLKTLVVTHLPNVKKIDVSYIFCTDAYLLQINQDFLQHDTFTDIITFDLSENDNHLVAEIYVSVDRIQENASKFEVSYQRELHRVIFHGMLHLCGFKDKSKKDAALMRSMEDASLATYFLK